MYSVADAVVHTFQIDRMEEAVNNITQPATMYVHVQ